MWSEDVGSHIVSSGHHTISIITMSGMLSKFTTQKKIVGSIAAAFVVVFPVWLVQVGGANKPGTLSNSYKVHVLVIAS
jgi:hypothetical protein